MQAKYTPSWMAGPPLPPADRIGTVLCGTYRLDELLGDGPTGTTYKAWHLLHQHAVRVKLVRCAKPLSQDLALTLVQDLRALSALRPRGLLSVELAFAPDGAPFLWADFCEGQSLRQVIRRGHLPVAAAGSTVAALALALLEVHRLGLVHGNLCPDNVILPPGPDAAPLLLDAALHPLRQAARADAKADISALGTLFYQCLTGRQKPTSPPPRLVLPPQDHASPALGRALEQIIVRSHARAPAEHTSSLERMLEELSEAYGAAGIEVPGLPRRPPARPVPPPAPAPSRSRPAPPAAEPSIEDAWRALAGHPDPAPAEEPEKYTEDMTTPEWSLNQPSQVSTDEASVEVVLSVDVVAEEPAEAPPPPPALVRKTPLPVPAPQAPTPLTPATPLPAPPAPVSPAPAPPAPVPQALMAPAPVPVVPVIPVPAPAAAPSPRWRFARVSAVALGGVAGALFAWTLLQQHPHETPHSEPDLAQRVAVSPPPPADAGTPARDAAPPADAATAAPAPTATAPAGPPIPPLRQPSEWPVQKKKSHSRRFRPAPAAAPDAGPAQETPEPATAAPAPEAPAPTP